VRKAARSGAAVGFVNPERYPYHFHQAANVEAAPEGFAAALGGVLAAVALSGVKLPGRFASLVEGIIPTAAQQAAAAVLLGKSQGLVLIGQWLQRHPRYSDLRALAGAIAAVSGARLGYITEGANAVGAALAGVTPHRDIGGAASQSSGLNAEAMITAPRHVYVLFNVEPHADLACAALAEQALLAADQVIVFTPYVTPELLRCADILLPIGTFAETAGTFVNGEGRWQSFDAAANLIGEARPGWRVLRVLGNALDLPDCEYRSAEDIRVELEQAVGQASADTSYSGQFQPSLDADPVEAALSLAAYACDSVVRRASALQARAGSDADVTAESAEAASA
jgi:NADH-quinone oxidoreductase subunit G